MLSFSRAIGAFFLMMLAGYLAVVLLLPAPDMTFNRTDEQGTARSDAVRLAEQAQALVSRKPAATLE